MRRGFFQSVPSPKGPNRVPVAENNLHDGQDGLSASTTCNGNTSPPSKYQGKPIFTGTDYTAIYDDVPLILHSDYRFDEAPYIGYLPPGAKEPSMLYIDNDVRNIETARAWPTWKQPEPPTIPGGERCFTIESVAGKGMAMVAKRTIKAGEMVYSERPIYVTSQTKAIAPDQGTKSGLFHRNAISRLGEKQRSALLSLSNCYKKEEMDEIPGRLGTNYLPVDVTPKPEEDASKYCGAFPTLSRANHSCAPNVNYFFHFLDFTGRFYAMRDIQAGEEVLIMYTDTLATCADRRDSLLESHRFICHCSFCSLIGVRLSASNDNRMYLRNMVDRLSETPGQIILIDELRKAVDLAEAEQVFIYKTQILHLGGASLLLHRTRAAGLEAVKWLRRAQEGYAIMEGEESYHVQELEELLGDYTLNTR